MRLGKPVEHLQAALRAAQSPAELGEQLATIGRQLAYFGYLTYDAIVWVSFFRWTRTCFDVLPGECSESHHSQAHHYSQGRHHLKPVLALWNLIEHHTRPTQGQNRVLCMTHFRLTFGCRPAGSLKTPRSCGPPNPGARKSSVT